ncbi:MAG: DUF2125 domain-containing protein [Bauldia sp.]|nr:DUF2125 domain-containing protein [Bauldia sp.]
MSQRGPSRRTAQSGATQQRRSPLVIYTVLAVGLLVVGGVFVAISGGASDDTEAPDVGAGSLLAGADGGPAQPAAGGEATPAADAGLAPELQEWAEGLRAAGYRIAFGNADGTSFGRVEIAGPEGTLGWIWAAENVSVTGLDGGEVTATVSGQPAAGTPARMQLTFSRDGALRTYNLTADVARIIFARNDAGEVTGVTLDATNLTIQPPDDTAPTTAARFQVTFAPAAGPGLLPDGTTGTLRIQELKMPGQFNGPLGGTMARLTANFTLEDGFDSLALAEELDGWLALAAAAATPGAGYSVTLSDIDLEWGLLLLTGSGSFGLDAEMRPILAVDAAIFDFLATIDPFDVAQGYDSALVADWVAALFERQAAGETTQNFDLTIADGVITLSSDDLGLAPLQLGTVGPIEVLAPAE